MRYAKLFNYVKKQCNFRLKNPNDKNSVTWNCDGKLTFVKNFAEANNLNFQAIKEKLNDTGGYCDCEVLFNSIHRIHGNCTLPDENMQKVVPK